MEVNKNSLTNDQIRFLQQTKPNLVSAIFTSVLALAIFVFCLISFINKTFGVWILFVGIVLVILMPATAWYGQFFLKKKNRKHYLEMKNETNQMLEYSKKLKGFKNVQYDEEENGFEVKYNEDLKLDSIHYDYERNTVNPEYTFTKLVSFGVSFFGFSINRLNRVYQVVGFLPKTTFYFKKIDVPESKKGELFFNNSFSEYSIINLLSDNKTFYDRKTFWSYTGLLSDLKNKNYTDSVMINKDVIVLLNGKHIIGLLVHLDK